MWIVYHVFPAVLAVSAGICLYISLCKLCETRTSWRRASALIAALAALFMLDLCSMWTLFMMHLCVFLLLWLLARRLSSRRLCWGLPLSCLLAAAMILGGMANARDIHATRVTIENERLDEDLRIAWLSDLHYPTSADAGALRQLVRRISDEQPDVIILGGDIVDEHTSAAQMEEAFDELGKLRSSLGIYYIYGNHDCARYSDQPAYSEEQLERAIARQGIEILCDERVLLRDDVMLVGRDDRTHAQGSRAAAEELMNLFKEVADIKTADQLNLPTPEVEYHNIVAQPTEHQKEMVQVLSERASRVHSGSVDPSEDNMLKITGDGRKLGLDQRIINQLLPDEPGTKVNQCVGNIMQIWREGEADKLTQLVFCDISTPQAAPSKKAAKQLDNPTLHALEQAVPLDEPEPAFTIYEDIRQKLIAQGMPAEQIAFIHEAKTEVQKKELFSKVRTGQVRVLLGSTSKMGAGTNVQDRLVALHDLDCPWRPGDLAQRKGRIERQGNQNPLVHVYRYVTEGTFDAYLWQTVENKQKFISQIMTSKSPVRSCDDVDETALSFAEIKALCAGDPRIKERMDLDVEVARLKLMKADHQSKQYRLEDQLLKYFPQEIETNKGFIKGFEADLETLAAHPHPEDGFAGMEIRGDVLTDKENAGAALLDACKEVKGSEPVQIGSYRGFTMSVEFSAWKQEYTLLLKGQMTHRASLGTDPRGNLTRIDNALAQMPQRLEAVKNQLDNLYQQQAAAKEEIGKPFPFEDDLRVKSARLVELDTLLNIDGKGHAQPETVVAKSARPSVLDSLKRPVPPRSPEKKPKQHEEVR